MGIAAKIADVQAEVQALMREEARVSIAGGGEYRYRYIPEATMFEDLRDRLASRQIATMQRTRLIGMDGNRAMVEVEVDFIDAECPPMTGTAENPIPHPDRVLTASMVATAQDKGDKQTSKAVTTCTRMLYWKTFRYPQADPDDAEGSSTQHQSAADQTAAELVADIEALAITKGLRGSTAEALGKITGGRPPVGSQLTDLRNLRKMVDDYETPPASQGASQGFGAAGQAPTSGPPPAPAETAAQTPPPAPSTPPPAPASGDDAPFGGGSAEAITKGQVARLEALAAQLVEVDPSKGDAGARIQMIDARSKEWYGKAVVDLDKDTAAKLTERVEDVLLKLKARAVAS